MVLVCKRNGIQQASLPTNIVSCYIPTQYFPHYNILSKKMQLMALYIPNRYVKGPIIQHFLCDGTSSMQSLHEITSSNNSFHRESSSYQVHNGLPPEQIKNGESPFRKKLFTETISKKVQTGHELPSDQLKNGESQPNQALCKRSLSEQFENWGSSVSQAFCKELSAEHMSKKSKVQQHVSKQSTSQQAMYSVSNSQYLFNGISWRKPFLNKSSSSSQHFHSSLADIKSSLERIQLPRHVSKRSEFLERRGEYLVNAHQNIHCPQMLTSLRTLPPSVHQSTSQSKHKFETKSKSQTPPSCTQTLAPQSSLKRFDLAPLLQPLTQTSGLSVLENDVRDDRAQERVLHCLRALAVKTKEVMVVVSQLQFGKYLRKPSYAAAASLFKRPIDLPQQYRRGELDVLIIHRQYGLIINEIKSVGSNFSELKLTQHAEDCIVVKRVREAVRQLNRAQYVLQYLVSDLKDVPVVKVLMVPNISSEQLLRAVRNDPQAVQEFCACLNVQTLKEAVEMTLCAEHLSDADAPWNVTPHVAKNLQRWWRAATQTKMQTITPTTYEHLVARFCGPATLVDVRCLTPPRLEVRTQGDAVSETGQRVSRIALVPEQIDLLNLSPDLAFLTGPPGTGKTLMLVLHGLAWLQRGHPVLVLSTWRESRAVTCIIQHQLLETYRVWHDDRSNSPHVLQHNYDFENSEARLKTAVRRLKTESLKFIDQSFCVLVDEPVPNYASNRKRFTQFCELLLQSIPKLCLWTASLHRCFRPPCLPEFTMTTPLRSPPVVVRVVGRSPQIRLTQSVQSYRAISLMAETDGPPVMTIKHRPGHLGHEGHSPDECEQCGREVHRVLESLHVGTDAMGDEVSNSRPPPLQYRDVIVLCNYPMDEHNDDSGQVTSPMGLVRGLRTCGVPVSVLQYNSDVAAIHEMALAVNNSVIVTHWSNVRGLEKKVVFVTKNDLRGLGSLYELHAASRCTSQLVWIDWSQKTGDTILM